MNTRSKLPDILLELHTKKKSGILRIQRESKKKQLVLQAGALAFAESNLPQEHLANIMVALNLIPKNRLTEIGEFMKGGKTSEEAILSLPESDPLSLQKGRLEQAVLITASLFDWLSCDVRLHPGSERVRNQFNLNLPLPELMVLAVRRAVTNRILAAPPEFVSGNLELSPSFEDAIFPLNQAELEACSLVQSRKPVSEILPLIPAGEAKPDQVLISLYQLGLVSWWNTQPVGHEDSDPSSNPILQNMNELLTRFKDANLYEVLSVSPESKQEDIQSAYHDKAKELHPDRFQTNEYSLEIRSAAEKVFAKINEAYHTLKNPTSRKLYDLELPKKAAAAKQKTGVLQHAETAEALFREGRSLFAKGDIETAVERFRGAVWLYPDKAAYHYHLGVAESRIPKYRKSAEQHLLKAIEMEDLSADCHLALARLYIDVHLPRKAELQLEQVALWDPDNPEARKLAADLKKHRP